LLVAYVTHPGFTPPLDDVLALLGGDTTGCFCCAFKPPADAGTFFLFGVTVDDGGAATCDRAGGFDEVDGMAKYCPIGFICSAR
jgi:hypothetical protein